MKKRGIKYLLYAIISVVCLFISISISIAVTGDRENKMMIFFLISTALILNIIFAFILLDSNKTRTIILGLVVTILAAAISIIITPITYVFVAIIIWELTYRIIEKQDKKLTSISE